MHRSDKRILRMETRRKDQKALQDSSRRRSIAPANRSIRGCEIESYLGKRIRTFVQSGIVPNLSQRCRPVRDNGNRLRRDLLASDDVDEKPLAIGRNVINI